VSQVGTRAGRREWAGLAVIALPCLLYSMDLTVLNLAVPQLGAALLETAGRRSPAGSSWPSPPPPP
jgi:MFS transporter, DHA2 family, multidrug resistance protein